MTRGSAGDAHDPVLRNHLELMLREIEENGGEALPPRVADAFRAAPRHLFLDRFRTRLGGAWHEVTAQSLPSQLPVIYRNTSLGIDGDADFGVTISQPYMVARMLVLLDLQPGQQVFEVGAGSGWNAALMGVLVQPGGTVESVEIREQLAERARAALARSGIGNVRVSTGDAAADRLGDERFDRAVFTCGAHDIPAALHRAIRPGGLLLFVWKVPCGNDALVLFAREQECFVSRDVRRCDFVPMTGANADSGPVTKLDAFAPWPALRDRVVSRRRFPAGAGAFRSISLRSWLSITEPRARFFESERGPAFGLWLEEAGSLALIAAGELTVHGSPAAGEALDRVLAEWARRGMPDAGDMQIRAYPTGSAPSSSEWIVRRPATDFVCSLPGSIGCTG
jgi:protein-L-isoaspartate(D-aspartate) O-methyltransferase